MHGNEWFVQHGGKQHGPMSSATLKRLASENKISPTTNVRLGTEGTGCRPRTCEETFPTAPAAQAKAGRAAAQAPSESPGRARSGAPR